MTAPAAGDGFGRGLRLVWMVLGVASFAMLVILFVLPSSWRVERQRELPATAEQVYPLLVDLHRWAEWSPWREKDYPGLVFHYAGPASGPGAEVSWETERTGDGLRRILAVQPAHQVSTELAVQRGRIRSTDVILLTALPNGHCRVTWTNQGSLGRTLLGRLQLGFIEDAMGRDLDKALAGLATAVGAPGVPTAAPSPSAAPG
jgi:hypothetical protein